MSPRRRPAVPARILDLEIEKLGTEGVGIARAGGDVVLVPETLPGERVRVRFEAGRGTLLERYSESADRIVPPCRHFGSCGGCVLQHLAPSPYADFKASLIPAALSRHGLGNVPIAPILVSPAGSRRRAILAAKRVGTGIKLGFYGRTSHQIVDLGHCPVLLPCLEALLPALRALLSGLLGTGAESAVTLTAIETGIDLGLGLPAEPGLAALDTLAGFAQEHDLARLWCQVEAEAAMPVAQRRPVHTHFGKVAVDLPPGAFLQATTPGEAALVAAVSDGLGGAKRIADLFAGVGTFALTLADSGGRAIHAVEGDAAARGALAAAARRAQLVRLTSECRDLDARPLLPSELSGFEAVVFDPPRAGAKAQVEQLAHSSVPLIIGVSCNPASFARDAAILAAGGYRLEAVLPVDQFLWSNQIELVGRFRRAGAG